MEVPTAYFTAALAWAAIVVNVTVLRFFFKRGEIYKDLVASGEVGLAISNIEANRLLPALASICGNVDKKLTSHREQGKSVTCEAVLNEWDYSPLLEDAQNAFRDQQEIQLSVDKLSDIASNIWKVGLLHALCIVGIPSAFLLANETLRTVAITSAVIAASITFPWAIFELFRFDRKEKRLHNKLGRNRGKKKITT